MTKGVTPIDDNIYIRKKQQKERIMNHITKQIIENNLPISDVTRTVTITGSELDNPVYKWYNKDTKKWYFGDKWSQKCNFSPNSAINCGGKYYINKIFLNHKITT